MGNRGNKLKYGFQVLVLNNFHWYLATLTLVGLALEDLGIW